MKKIYTALGLMSGTSMDGVDASIIQTDCESNFEAILNRYYQYDDDYKTVFDCLFALKSALSVELSKLKSFAKAIRPMQREA